jgi:hypothetical protein
MIRRIIAFILNYKLVIILNLMKKGPKPATTPSPNLEDLLSKYDAEKELLLK